MEIFVAIIGGIALFFGMAYAYIDLSLGLIVVLGTIVVGYYALIRILGESFLEVLKKTWVDTSIVLCALILLTYGFFCGFTKKQQAIKLCDKESRTSQAVTTGSAWDVDFSENTDGTYFVSYRKDLSTYSSNGVGGLIKNKHFICSNIELSPIPIPGLMVMLIIGLVCYSLFVRRQIPFNYENL